MECKRLVWILTSALNQSIWSHDGTCSDARQTSFLARCNRPQDRHSSPHTPTDDVYCETHTSCRDHCNQKVRFNPVNHGPPRYSSCELESVYCN